MTIIIELDKKYAGFGIEWYKKVKGIRLGYIAIHIIMAKMDDVVEFIQKSNGYTILNGNKLSVVLNNYFCEMQKLWENGKTPAKETVDYIYEKYIKTIQSLIEKA